MPKSNIILCVTVSEKLKQNFFKQTYTREECHVKTEAESRVMQPQLSHSKDLQSPLETRKSQGRMFSSTKDSACLCRHLEFRFLASRTVRECTSVIV